MNEIKSINGNGGKKICGNEYILTGKKMICDKHHYIIGFTID